MLSSPTQVIKLQLTLLSCVHSTCLGVTCVMGRLCVWPAACTLHGPIRYWVHSGLRSVSHTNASCRICVPCVVCAPMVSHYDMSRAWKYLATHLEKLGRHNRTLMVCKRLVLCGSRSSGRWRRVSLASQHHYGVTSDMFDPLILL